MIPACDAENNICIGNLFWVNYFASFTFDTVSTIAACFCYSALVNLVNAGQNHVILMICVSIAEPTVGVFAEVNFLEDISVVEIVDFGGGFG
jgi:hypothetical protein